MFINYMQNTLNPLYILLFIASFYTCSAVMPMPSHTQIKKIYFKENLHLRCYSKSNDHSVQTVMSHKQIKPPLALRNSIETGVNNAYDIYIINLERRKDRWDTISKCLDSQNISYTRIDAVDGKRLFTSDQDMIEKGYVTQKARNNNPFLTRGAIALGLSAREVWEKCRSSNKPYCVVLEDDIILRPDFGRKLYNLLDDIDHYPFDILMLHQNVYGFWGKSKDQENIYNAEWLQRKNKEKIINSVMGFSGAAYIIKGPQSAQKLLEGYTLPFDTAVDMVWWGTYDENREKYPDHHRNYFTENRKANKIVAMQTHPLWYKNPCATSSQCTNDDTSLLDSDIED